MQQLPEKIKNVLTGDPFYFKEFEEPIRNHLRELRTSDVGWDSKTESLLVSIKQQRGFELSTKDYAHLL